MRGAFPTMDACLMQAPSGAEQLTVSSCAEAHRAHLPRLSKRDMDKLEAQLLRASEFERAEDLNLMRQPLSGPLQKFTNPLQGWQMRW